MDKKTLENPAATQEVAAPKPRTMSAFFQHAQTVRRTEVQEIVEENSREWNATQHERN